MHTKEFSLAWFTLFFPPTKQYTQLKQPGPLEEEDFDGCV
jgi:hypothetical protein